MSFNINKKLPAFLALAAPLLLGGCKLPDMVLLQSKGQIGIAEWNLILLSTALMLLVVIPVIVLAIWFSFHYRAENKKATYAPNWEQSHKIEAIVWGVPCLIVLALSIVCWRSTHELDPFKPLQSSVKPIEIDVVSLDWKWLFIYPEQQIATVNEVAFPVNTPIDFEITSDSVMNSFFIPQLGSQIYAMAGMKARDNLIADQIGAYEGLSANFSGDGFAGMRFSALATSPADFDAWVAKARQSPMKLDDETYAALHEPSQFDPVHYYSWVKPMLFDDVIARYMGMPMDKDMKRRSMNQVEPMDMKRKMNRGNGPDADGSK